MITLVNMLVSHLSKVFNSVLMTVCAALSRIPQVRCRTPVCGRQRGQTHPNRSPALLGSETFSTVPRPTALAPLFDEGVEKQSARHDSLQASTFSAIIHSYLHLPKGTSTVLGPQREGTADKLRSQARCDGFESQSGPVSSSSRKSLLQKPMCSQN